MHPNQYYKKNDSTQGDIRIHIVLPKKLVLSLDQICSNLNLRRSLVIREILTKSIRKRDAIKKEQRLRQKINIDSLSEHLQKIIGGDVSELISSIKEAQFENIEYDVIEGL